MTCQDVQQQLFDFLDGTCHRASHEAMQRHLATCAPCHTTVAEVARVENQLHGAFADESVPATLWSRICADLQAEKVAAMRVGRNRRVGLWWVWATAALLLLGISWSFITTHSVTSGALEARLLSVPAQDLHTFVISQRPLDVASTDPQQVRQWFQGKVDFSPPIPPMQAGAAQLAGGRLCYFLERRVASYMYVIDGHYLSLYVMPRHGLPALPGETVPLAMHHATVHDVQGYTQIIWTHTDLLYSLISDLPRSQLFDMARKVVQTG